MVTGGGSGIGRATCTRLTADGFTLAVLDVDGEAAKVAAGPDGLGCAADVADRHAVDAAFAQVVEAFGRIDVLVNNAGVSGTVDATVCHETTVEEWDRVLAINTRGPFLCARAALPVMLAQGDGHVITVASVAGQVAFPGRVRLHRVEGRGADVREVAGRRLRRRRDPVQRRLPRLRAHPL